MEIKELQNERTKESEMWEPKLGRLSTIFQPITFVILLICQLSLFVSGTSGGGDGLGFGEPTVTILGIAMLIFFLLWFALYAIGFTYTIKNRRHRDLKWWVLLIFSVLGLYPIFMATILLISYFGLSRVQTQTNNINNNQTNSTNSDPLPPNGSNRINDSVIVDSGTNKILTNKDLEFEFSYPSAPAVYYFRCHYSLNDSEVTLNAKLESTNKDNCDSQVLDSEIVMSTSLSEINFNQVDSKIVTVNGKRAIQKTGAQSASSISDDFPKYIYTETQIPLNNNWILTITYKKITQTDTSHPDYKVGTDLSKIYDSMLSTFKTTN